MTKYTKRRAIFVLVEGQILVNKIHQLYQIHTKYTNSIY